MKTILLFLLITACAQKPVSISPQITEFVETWKSDYTSNSNEAAQRYQSYLTSVELIYAKSEQSHKFPDYLSTLHSNFQILLDREYNVAGIYRKTVKDRRKMSFNQWKQDHLKDLRDRLTSQREQKLKEQVGTVLFEKLKENHKEFREFPL